MIFVRVAFRPALPEISPRNRTFSAIASRVGTSFGEEDEATQIHPAVGARPEDPVVLKKRVSAFAGSDLEVLLRSFGATHLVLAGIATSGVVLSTLREAADRDYELTVLSDACADQDDEVHRVLTEKVFPPGRGGHRRRVDGPSRRLKTRLTGPRHHSVTEPGRAWSPCDGGSARGMEAAADPAVVAALGSGQVVIGPPETE